MALIHFNHFSKCKGRQTNVVICLPTDGMQEQRNGTTIEVPGMKYQVLWLLHGGGGDESDFVNYSNIVRWADEHRIAVVMPAGDCFYDVDYGYVTEELPRLLRVLFPFSDSKEDNFIGGLSHGGDGALRACLEHPDRYAAGLIMSAAGTDHRGEVDQAALRFDVFGLAARLADCSGQLPKLIFATGSGDRGFPYYTPVIDRLEAMGLPVTRHYVDGDGHSWNFWDDTLRLALRELLPISHHTILP